MCRKKVYTVLLCCCYDKNDKNQSTDETIIKDELNRIINKSRNGEPFNHPLPQI